VRLITLPGVFKPHSDSWALAGLLGDHVRPGDSVLDVCTGSGLLAVAAAQAGAGDVTAVDISRRAVLTTRANARLNGVRIDARQGDLFGAVAQRRFDVIVSNPPYVPSPEDRLPARGAARAWEGGFDGRAILDRICAHAPRHLRPGGSLLLVHSSVCGEKRTVVALREAGMSAELVARRRGPLGRLLNARASLLTERGLLDAGASEEELLFIVGRMPTANAADFEPATIVPYRDGPYVVSGSFVMRDQEGGAIDVARRTVALCRCGRSKQRPFCDGTHKTTGFRAISGIEDRPAAAGAAGPENTNGHGNGSGDPPSWRRAGSAGSG
jgi:release factor glutamine methyltransferase